VEAEGGGEGWEEDVGDDGGFLESWGRAGLGCWRGDEGKGEKEERGGFTLF